MKSQAPPDMMSLLLDIQQRQERMEKGQKALINALPEIQLAVDDVRVKHLMQKKRNGLRANISDVSRKHDRSINKPSSQSQRKHK